MARSKWPIGIAALFGAWLFVSAFVLTVPVGDYWNNIVVGAAIAILAAYSGYTRGGSRAASALAALLGLWAIVTPFVYAGGSPTLLYSDVITGIVVAVLAGYDTYLLGRMGAGETASARQAA